jgi:WXG100 family type VII secretion target
MDVSSADGTASGLASCATAMDEALQTYLHKMLDLTGQLKGDTALAFREHQTQLVHNMQAMVGHLQGMAKGLAAADTAYTEYDENAAAAL